jgi:uncharacterized membrane protein (UPF0127 family)
MPSIAMSQDVAPMRRLALTGMLLALAACGGNGADEGARAIIATSTGEVVVHVEVADTEAERRHGLMGRRMLGADAGMAFVFQEPDRGAFWMKDTLIPLSIAFYDEDGRILRILDMEPCPRDPCRLYDPGVAYRGALEVNRGAFRRWGVSEGDRLRLDR